MTLTRTFINLINDMKRDYSTFIEALESAKKSGARVELNRLIITEFDLDTAIKSHNMTDSLKINIEQFLQQQNVAETMPYTSLQAISKQLDINILLYGSDVIKVFHRGLSSIMGHHGIRTESLPAFSQRIFWINLLRRLYALSMISSTGMPEINTDKLPEHLMPDEVRLTNAIKHIDEALRISIETIDGEVHFKKRQEQEIVRRLESDIRKFGALNFIHLLVQHLKILKKAPVLYLLNLSVKQVAYRSHSSQAVEKFEQIILLSEAYIALYQLKSSNFWERIQLNTQSIEMLLKKQVLFAVGYHVDTMSTETLKTMIRELLFKSVTHGQLMGSIGFDANKVCALLDNLEKSANAGVTVFSKNGPHEAILNTLAIGIQKLNINYGPISSLEKVVNSMALYPVVEYDGSYYVFGYDIQKTSFYNAILMLLNKNVDNGIFTTIGINIDRYMINTFSGHTTYDGKYRVKKGYELECDLVVELDDEIIFIENKNKSMTAESYSGSSIYILKDLIMSFVASQMQLLRHEEYLQHHGQIVFKDGRTLKLNGKKISKISMTSLNWSSIMLNDVRATLYALSQMRFSFFDHTLKKEKKMFEDANEQLDKLSVLLRRIEGDPKLDLHTMLMHSLFLPLELVVEFGKDALFVQSLQRMFRAKIQDGNNPIDHYRYIEKLLSNAE